MSDTQVYEPLIRALLETDSHFCEVTLMLAGGRVDNQGADPAADAGVAPEARQAGQLRRRERQGDNHYYIIAILLFIISLLYYSYSH